MGPSHRLFGNTCLRANTGCSCTWIMLHLKAPLVFRHPQAVACSSRSLITQSGFLPENRACPREHTQPVPLTPHSREPTSMLPVSPADPATAWKSRWERDSPHTRGLAQVPRPGPRAALPGTVLPVRLPGALALLLLVVLLVIELLDPVLVAHLEQVGVGLQGARWQGGVGGGCRGGGGVGTPPTAPRQRTGRHSHSRRRR